MNWFQGRRVVVPFDFSEASVEAVRVGLQIAANPDEVHVLHVLMELPATDPAIIWGDVDDQKRSDITRQTMSTKLNDHGIHEQVQLNVSTGNAGQVIADLAEEIGAGLIVIPSHGYTGFQRFLLGSVAERVVRLAHCPVLVLKAHSESQT